MFFPYFLRSHSLQKYSPLDWQGFFDKEEDITILGTNDVS
jgi:hypothetical protein